MIDKKFLHKTSNLITKNYDEIVAEDLNIIELNTLGQSGINACGDEKLFSSMKQEKEYLDNQVDAMRLNSCGLSHHSPHLNRRQ